MESEINILFPPFHLDLANEQLWREEQLIALRPKTFAILRYLVEHPNRLVTKDELLHSVWGETLVSEEGLRDYLREIRQALGDEADAPRFIETVRGRGYRFLPPVTTQSVQSSKFKVQSQDDDPTPNPQPLTPSLPLPDKPSLIVLPFINLSNDPDQEYFSDGITEDITNSLSRLSSLFVISRTSAFAYKGKPTKVQDISTEMGVRYVLEGSIRRSNTQVRVTAQLIDAIADHHLWAERYDRPLTDIFALQDEIVQKIVTTLRLQLTLWEQGIPVRKRTDNPEAYDYNLRGIEFFVRLTKAANTQARQLYEKAIELDPQYAEAYARLAWTYLAEWIWLWSLDPQTLEQAFALASKALTLDGSMAYAHTLLGYVYLLKKQHEQAIAEGEQALIFDPNFAIGHLILAEILILAGRLEDAIQMAKKGMQLDPRNSLYSFQLGHAYQLMGRYEEALTAFRRVLTWNPHHVATRRHLAVIYSELGQEEEARAECAAILKLAPDSSLEIIKQRLPYKDPAIAEHYLESLRKAGLR